MIKVRREALRSDVPGAVGIGRVISIKSHQRLLKLFPAIGCDAQMPGVAVAIVDSNSFNAYRHRQKPTTQRCV